MPSSVPRVLLLFVHHAVLVHVPAVASRPAALHQLWREGDTVAGERLYRRSPAGRLERRWWRPVRVGPHFLYLPPTMFRTSIAATPPGALDLTGDAVRRRRALQRAMMAVLDAGRFEELSPPTFEYEEVFRRAGGADVAEKLVRFVDLDGRILALRYDFTS